MASPSTESEEHDQKQALPQFVNSIPIQKYNYTPSYQGNKMRISRQLVSILFNCIRERIENIYDFIGKLTAIAEYDGTVMVINNNTVKLFNCGFHEKQSNEVLYLVAVANATMKRQHPLSPLFVMTNAVYTQHYIYNKYKLRQCPLSWYQNNNITHISNTSKVNEILLSTAMQRQIIFKTKWHKLPIFHSESKLEMKEYNKRRVTFLIKKTEFIEDVERFIHNESNAKPIKPLVPIIMFASDEERYRVEFVQIVRIREDSDIGISYFYNHRKNTIQPTGIHLNKNNILYQHQLTDPHHDCHCLDEFRSIIDDLHIGNPDEDKNRCKDLQKRLKCLQKSIRKKQVKHQHGVENLELALKLRSEFIRDEQLKHKDEIKNLDELVQGLRAEVQQLRSRQHEASYHQSPPSSGLRPLPYPIVKLSPPFTTHPCPSTANSTLSYQPSYREGMARSGTMSNLASQCLSEGCATKFGTGECGAIERVRSALDYYENVDEKQTDDGDLVHACNSIYKSLLEDWIHVMTEHSKNTNLIFPCEPHDILYCPIANRHYFNKMVHDINVETEAVFYRELLDSIHCYVYHLEDVGLRVLTKCRLEQSDDITDLQLAHIRTTQKSKAKILHENGLEMSINIDKTNKYDLIPTMQSTANYQGTLMDMLCRLMDRLYATNNGRFARETQHCFAVLLEEDYDSESVEYDLEDVSQSNFALHSIACYNAIERYLHLTKLYRYTFSIGYRFYYHHWSKFKSALNMTHTPMNDDPNDLQSHSIKAKYKSLQDEILNNTISHLPKIEFNVSLVKANKYLETRKAKQMVCILDEFGYGFKKGDTIRRSHLLSIILYCQYTKLQRELTTTFRKNEEYECIESVIQRHREFAIWSRLLREAVEIFGECGG
eukprot:799341_1